MALVTGSCYGQPIYVPAPPVLPLPYGLFSISNMLTEDDPHWQQGVEWISEPGCVPARVYACPTCVQNNGNTAPAKTYDRGVQIVQALPFTVYASFACSPIGFYPEEGFDRARRGLINAEERAVENEIALGTKHTGNSFTSATTVDITPTVGTPVTVAQGVALLEQYIAGNSAGQGAILMARRDAVLATNQHVLHTEDETHLYTKLWTPTAAVGGFDGRTGPNNVAASAGNAWIFATGSKPNVRRSEIFTMPDVPEHGLSQRTNDFNILAERTYSINWDCFTAGVLVQSV